MAVELGAAWAAALKDGAVWERNASFYDFFFTGLARAGLFFSRFYLSLPGSSHFFFSASLACSFLFFTTDGGERIYTAWNGGWAGEHGDGSDGM
jgi:hypothetical protein